MAEKYKGNAVRIEFGANASQADLRMLDLLLDRSDAVAAYSIDVENNVLTAYLDGEVSEAEEALVRAVFALGMYPRTISDTGFTHKDGSNAC